jgi:FAD synthase
MSFSSQAFFRKQIYRQLSVKSMLVIFMEYCFRSGSFQRTSLLGQERSLHSTQLEYIDKTSSELQGTTSYRYGMLIQVT